MCCCGVRDKLAELERSIDVYRLGICFAVVSGTKKDYKGTSVTASVMKEFSGAVMFIVAGASQS